MVSIIIPVYNVSKYLSTCLDSAVNQTYKDLEIICINDGSTDDSLEILKEYADKDNRIIIIDKKNSGVSAARNDGIEKSNGEYIFFMDSDDYIDNDFIEVFYNNAEKNNSDLVVLSSFWNLDKRVNKDYHSALPTWSMFIKKYILDDYKYLRYPLNVQPGEDGIFSHELLMYTKNVSFVYNTNYHYVKRPGQDSQRAVKEPFILVNAIPKWFEILEDFYTKYNFWESKSLSFAKYIEGEAFLAFRTKNFTVEDERKVFDIIKSTLNKVIKNISTEDYNKYFSKEFIILIESDTIKEYYSKIKCKYNYIRFTLFGKDVSIRYRENRYKYYENDK
ncbi:glycosyltransferase family 2 protein [Brachyspira hampsonii]|uniref:glycosyltransferase family 2 protein n=1 Tax=Brachyspira hampsonii TaxID=1287055 RepID=UPI001C664A72|nr:glycosyltransferase family 2 protein [Brachyspira hampsonii]MBW5381342.1 glycosyltransferase family 2 protein [Brachyspira hampsonii]